MELHWLFIVKPPSIPTSFLLQDICWRSKNWLDINRIPLKWHDNFPLERWNCVLLPFFRKTARNRKQWRREGSGFGEVRRRFMHSADCGGLTFTTNIENTQQYQADMDSILSIAHRLAEHFKLILSCALALVGQQCPAPAGLVCVYCCEGNAFHLLSPQGIIGKMTLFPQISTKGSIESENWSIF